MCCPLLFCPLPLRPLLPLLIPLLLPLLLRPLLLRPLLLPLLQANAQLELDVALEERNKKLYKQQIQQPWPVAVPMTGNNQEGGWGMGCMGLLNSLAVSFGLRDGSVHVCCTSKREEEKGTTRCVVLYAIYCVLCAVWYCMLTQVL